MGIERTADVCGGSARVAGTRIPIWLLEQARRMGSTEAELLAAYPKLRTEELATAWGYARAHVAEMDREIAENEDG